MLLSVVVQLMAGELNRFGGVSESMPKCKIILRTVVSKRNCFVVKSSYSVLRGICSAVQSSYSVLRGICSVVKSSYSVLRGIWVVVKSSYSVLRGICYVV